MSSGAMHALYLVPETNYGEIPATPAFDLVRQTGVTIGLSKDTLQSAELRPDRQITSIRHGTRRIGGDINFELSYGSQDALLEAVLCGTWTGNVLKAGVARKSFTALRHFSDLTDVPYWTYLGVEMNTLQLTMGANAIVKGTFGTIGQDQPLSTAAEPTGATLGVATEAQVMDSFTGAMSIAGKQLALTTEITLSLTNGMDTRFVIGSDKTLRPTLKRSTLTGQVTAYFESGELVNEFIREGDVSLTFTVSDPEGNQYQFSLPKIKFTGGQPDVTGEDDIMLTMPFTAQYDKTLDSQISITRIPKAPELTSYSFALDGSSNGATVTGTAPTQTVTVADKSTTPTTTLTISAKPPGASLGAPAIKTAPAAATATATISGGKLVVTNKAAGTTTIVLTDGAGHDTTLNYTITA